MRGLHTSNGDGARMTDRLMAPLLILAFLVGCTSGVPVPTADSWTNLAAPTTLVAWPGEQVVVADPPEVGRFSQLFQWPATPTTRGGLRVVKAETMDLDDTTLCVAVLVDEFMQEPDPRDLVVNMDDISVADEKSYFYDEDARCAHPDRFGEVPQADIPEGFTTATREWHSWAVFRVAKHLWYQQGCCLKVYLVIQLY